jgi:RimJ/RimL family protein N-acetyltransferase
MINNIRAEAITTDRLILRRFTKTDEATFVKIITNPEVYRFLGDGKGLDDELAKKIMTAYMYQRGIFAVVEKTSNRLIGWSGIRMIPDGRIELLYGYDPELWGKGYGTEAGKAVLEYGKANLEIDELIAMAYPENPGSIGIMKKLGFASIGQEEHFGQMLEVYSLKISNDYSSKCQ